MKPGDRQVGVPIPEKADGGPEMISEQHRTTSAVWTLSLGQGPGNRLLIQLGQAAVFQFPISPLFPGLLCPTQLEAWPRAAVPLL